MEHEGEILKKQLEATGMTMVSIAERLDMTRQNLNYHLRKQTLDKRFLLLVKDIILNRNVENIFSDSVNIVSETEVGYEKTISKKQTKPPDAEQLQEQIKLLIETPCVNSEVKNAFLFCLNTGIDAQTVRNLMCVCVSDGFIKFNRTKTNQENKVPLNDFAQSMADEIVKEKSKGYLFDLPTSQNGCNKALKAWVKNAGINKHITWHCARHTFAMLLLNDYGEQITTVSELLGHSDLKTTQRYAKAVMKLKEIAVNKIDFS